MSLYSTRIYGISAPSSPEKSSRSRGEVIDTLVTRDGDERTVALTSLAVCFIGKEEMESGTNVVFLGFTNSPGKSIFYVCVDHASQIPTADAAKAKFSTSGKFASVSSRQSCIAYS